MAGWRLRSRVKAGSPCEVERVMTTTSGLNPVGAARPTQRCRFMLLIVSVVLIVAGLPALYYWNVHRFDQAIWLASRTLEPDSLDYPRSRMVSDLLWRHLRLGMRKDQVRALLGEPDGESSDSQMRTIDKYWIGYYGWLAIDPSFLRLTYDSSGKLIEIDIYET